jgi:hypothetical protein
MYEQKNNSENNHQERTNLFNNIKNYAVPLAIGLGGFSSIAYGTIIDNHSYVIGGVISSVVGLYSGIGVMLWKNHKKSKQADNIRQKSDNIEQIVSNH